MKHIVLTVLIVFSMGLGLQATTYDLISDLGSSAKMISIGNIEGFDHSAASIFENPAALTNVDRLSVSAFYTSFISGDVTYLSYSGAYRSPFGVFSAGLMSTSVPDIHHTGSANNRFFSKETFNYENTIMKLGYQVDVLPGISAGLALTQFTHKIFTVSGDALDADFGVLLRHWYGETSISAKHLLGADISYSDGSKENAPTQYVVGHRWPMEMLLGMSDLDFFTQYRFVARESASLLSAGLSYVPLGLEMISVSAGWQQYLVLSDVNSKVTLGMHLYLAPFSLNFAYEKSDFHLDDHQYYLSTSLDF